MSIEAMAAAAVVLKVACAVVVGEDEGHRCGRRRGWAAVAEDVVDGRS